MEFKINLEEYKDLNEKFNKRKFKRERAVKHIDCNDFFKQFQILFLNYIFLVAENATDKLLFTQQDFSFFDSTKFKEDNFDFKIILRSLIFIIAKIGYAPFKKFHFVYFYNNKGFNYYFDVTAFAKINLNFFNYLCCNQICDYLKGDPYNNFYQRLKVNGLEVVKGFEYLFVKSYMTQETSEDKKALSGDISQIRNWLYATENGKEDLLKKIKILELKSKFIEFKMV
jgi:hypothetical protein